MRCEYEKWIVEWKWRFVHLGPSQKEELIDRSTQLITIDLTKFVDAFLQDSEMLNI